MEEGRGDGTGMRMERTGGEEEEEKGGGREREQGEGGLLYRHIYWVSVNTIGWNPYCAINTPPPSTTDLGS